MWNDRDSPVAADERLGFLFTVARDPMLLADATEPLRDAAIVDCNHLAVELLGYQRDELIARPLSFLEPPAGSGAAAPSGEVQVRRKDGQVLTVERSVEDVDSNGARYRILALHDVTASRLLERALLRIQQMDNLGAVSGAAVHDFRNLLVGVVANADLALRSASLDDEARKHIRDIQVSAERATELAERILPHAAGEDRGFEHVDLGVLVREAVDLVRMSLPDDATIALELAGDLPPILADATQVRQVTMNLVINAAEALPGSGVITLRTGLRNAAEADLREARIPLEAGIMRLAYLEVSDDGRGMDAATRERVFEPLFTTKAAGTGLGLAAVMFAARRHRGTVTVRSSPGRGSAFRLYLPADT